MQYKYYCKSKRETSSVLGICIPQQAKYRINWGNMIPYLEPTSCNGKLSYLVGASTIDCILAEAVSQYILVFKTLQMLDI